MSKPYEEYVDRAMVGIPVWENISKIGDGIVFSEAMVGLFTEKEFRNKLIDAWMEGLKYSLVIIESEKRGRDVQQD
jgi:hypothetical protein